MLQTIDKGVVSEGVHRLSLEPATKGIYLIPLTIGNETTYKKISKM